MVQIKIWTDNIHSSRGEPALIKKDIHENGFTRDQLESITDKNVM